MTIAIKPTASGSTIEQNGSTILTVDGSGNITPSNQMYPKVPAFSAYMSAAQTFTAVTWTKIVFDTEEFDTNSNYDITNYRFTPTVAGYYQVNIGFKVESVTSRGVVALYKNGDYYKFGDDIQGTYLRNITGSFLVYLNGSTDYIEAYGYQGNGTSNAVSQTFQTHFSGVLVSV